VGVGVGGLAPSSNPPDVNGRVGATQYVQWNNTSFAVFNKTTGALVYGPAAGNTLFQKLGGVCASHNDGDPVVAYDVLAGRWILSQFVVGGPTGSFSHQCIAVSVTQDATGAYYLYDFLTDGINFVDYPHIGVWPDGYYMSAHVFNAAGTTNVAARVYVFERDKMILGQAARMQSKDLPKDGSGFQYGFLPADLDSLTPPPAGAQEYIIGPNAQFTNRTDISRVAVVWGATPTMTLTSTVNTTVGIGTAPCVSNTAGASNRDCVPQAGAGGGANVPTDDLDNLVRHYMYRLAYRNNGGTESIIATGTTNGATTTPAHGAIKWMEWRGATGSSAPTLFQSGTYDPTSTASDYRWMSSGAMDSSGNIAIGYSKSSNTTRPSIWITGRLSTDTAGTMGAEALVQAGGGVQTAGGGNRWGDYSAMTIDPVDQCTFWYTNEYLKTDGNFNWSTRIVTYKFPSCTPATWGTITGHVQQANTGAALSGVTVTLNNGYAGSTNAAGNYSISVPAGSYTATAADADRNCTSAVPSSRSVTVSNGVTTSGVDFVMDGGSNLQSNSLTVDDSTSGNNNGIINRDECVALNVGLANNGCANESAISATLTTTTPGVTITQPNSAYPNLAVDATGSNVTQFKLQTSSSFACGTVINLSLNTTYAGGSKSIALSIPTCAGGANQTIPSSQLTTADTFQTDREGRTGTASTCAGKPAPGGGFTGTHYYKTFTFTNTSGAAACFTVTINAALGGPGDIESVAYDQAYIPASIDTNYLGDTGISGLGTTVGSASYSFTVPAGHNFVVVVNQTGTALSGVNASSVFSGTVAGFVNNGAGPGACPVSIVTTTLTAAPATGTYGGTANLSATLTDGTNGISGKSISFTLNGNSAGSATTNASGVATISNASLTGINAGSYPTGVGASFAGDSGYTSSNSTAALTVNKADQTITFNALADKTYGDADFSVSATASSGLTVSFAASGNCTVSGSTVHITGAGSCTITASQAGNSNYNAAPNVGRTFNIAKANTTTTVTVSNASFDGNPHGGTASVTGPAGLNQGLTVSYSGRNTTVYGPSTTAPTAAGDYTASASYAGDSNYNPSSDSKDYSIAKASQTITFGALADKTYGDADFSVSASASSGLAVSFSASGNCTVSGSTVHITGGGSCTITASQGGDSNYNAAPNVDRSFNIAKANQTITFAALSDKTYGDADFSVSATASSGLTVGFAASGNCTVSGSTVHITGGGSCTITASQGGDSNYNAAPNVDRSFNIAKANQTITFAALSDKTYGDADFLVSATASSGLTVSFAASGNCTVTGTTVHLTGAGSCMITASQSGDSNYNAASDVARSFNIAKGSATVTLSNLSQTYDGTPKSATATTNPAGLNVTITYTPVPGAPRSPKVAGGPTNAGSYTVQATIDDPNYEGSASDTLVIAKANATINVSGYTGDYDGNPHGVTGTATGAQSEDLSSLLDLGSSYTNVPGGTAHWTFNASNTNTNYNSASGDVSITINKATPTINWSNPADIIYGTALSGTQLNATGSVPGSFVYTPAAGTVLGYGNGQNLHAAFTPTDTTNYNNATKDVAINVLSALLTTKMVVDRDPALVGYNHNYLIDIDNSGSASATSMTLSDPLPSQVRFTAVTTSQGSCSYNSGTHTVNCTLGTVGVGGNVHIQLTTKTLQAGTLNNTATVLASQWDPATGGNTASVNDLEAIATTDVAISKVDSVDPIFVGQTTTYTIVVKNYNTPISATGVVMTDNLPASFQFVSATTSQGSLVTPPVGSTGIVTANVGTLAINGTATITITVRATAPGTITNTATASENENDSNTVNNSASQSTTVNVAALQKVLLASQTLVGGCQNTTGNVYLTGPAPTGGITVNLSTTNLAGVTVPASVFIPAGQTVSPAFNVTTSPVATKQVGTVNATLGSTTVSRGLTVNVGSGTCP
jgi:uncharacterized repeat protein (TIGR01451 family)